MIFEQFKKKYTDRRKKFHLKEQLINETHYSLFGASL